MPNPNPDDGRYQQTINADERNKKYRKIISSIVAEHTECFRCKTLSFCEPKCISWKQIVGTLNTYGVPTPARARKGLPIEPMKLIPEDTPDHLVPSVREDLQKLDTGVWDDIQVKRTLRLQGRSAKPSV